MRLFRRREPAGYDRKAALRSKPEAVRPIRSEFQEDGRMTLTVERDSPGWMRMLSGRNKVEHKMRLDTLGIEVYDACDGKTTVATIIRRFARTHQISEAEAEISVTTFLKTLVTKGLVVIAVDRQSLERNR